jgi:polar amino acid transport system substrate-binding protein
LQAYEVITGKRKEDFLGILLHYSETPKSSPQLHRPQADRSDLGGSKEKLTIGFIGAGNFAQSYLLPHLLAGKHVLQTVVTQIPSHAMSVQSKFSFRNASSNADDVLNDPLIDSVFIATRHDSHAGYVVSALKAGKNVFVEKPLAVTEEQLTGVGEAAQAAPHCALAVGFNRRFSKPFNDIKSFFRGRIEPMMISYRVNAGALLHTHWVYHESQGGRIIGEACHFIDVMMFLTNAQPVRVYAELLGTPQQAPSDNVLASITFSDGSVGSLLYLSNGNLAVPKELCEITCEKKTAIMENFDSVITYHDRKRTKTRHNGKKGHQEEVAHFVRVCRGKEQPVPFESLRLATLTTFKIMESLRRRVAVDI